MIVSIKLFSISLNILHFTLKKKRILVFFFIYKFFLDNWTDRHLNYSIEISFPSIINTPTNSVRGRSSFFFGKPYFDPNFLQWKVIYLWKMLSYAQRSQSSLPKDNLMYSFFPFIFILFTRFRKSRYDICLLSRDSPH